MGAFLAAGPPNELQSKISQDRCELSVSLVVFGVGLLGAQWVESGQEGPASKGLGCKQRGQSARAQTGRQHYVMRCMP